MGRFFSLIWLGILILLLVACSTGSEAFTPSPAGNQSGAPSAPEHPVTQDLVASESPATPTKSQPSATPLPLIAIVNGLEITQAEYQAELALFEQAVTRELTPEDEERVLNDLIDQALFAQAAEEQGYQVDQTLLQERLDLLVAGLDGQDALEDWMRDYGYTEDSFQGALKRAVAAAWMRDEVIAKVPESAEQIHARQILLLSKEEANEVLAKLQAGNSFDNLAAEYDPVTRGELGWFPRGYLPDENLERVAFGLQLNEYSPVVASPAGFHILVIVERDPQRPLNPDALLVVRAQALQDWLANQRKEADIQVINQ